MAEVLDVRGFQLEPNVLGRFALGRKLGQQQLQQQQQDQISKLLGQAVSPGRALVPGQPQEAISPGTPQATPGVEQLGAVQAPPTQADLIQQARQIDPLMAEKQLKLLGLDTSSKRAEASRFAAEVQSLPIEIQNQRIQQRVVELRSQGRDPSDTEQLLTMPIDLRQQALTGVQLLDLSTKERFAVQAKAAGITGKPTVKKSVILEDGTVQSVLSDNTVTVQSLNELQKELIRRGRERGVDIQQRRAQARETGKGTAKFIEKTFETTDKLRSNNNTLRQVIDSVRGGAVSGPLVNMLPSFRAESIRLVNLKNRLGLEVVGSVKFGALSEKELLLALNTALPPLRGPDLIVWADAKIAAQEKLAAYLEEQAIFLSEPGRKRADWTKFMKEKQRAAQNQKPAVDAAPQAALTSDQRKARIAELRSKSGT